MTTATRVPAVHPHVTRANAYARGVVSGKILACKWVKLACKRHIDDLKRAKGSGFPYRFDAARAERSCQFAELFRHVKGHWAIPVPGDPLANRIRLSDYQCFTRSMIRGWVEKATGLRRFRVVYIEVPRKNGKSTDAATHGLENFAADGEYGAEVYSGATTEKQAWEVFRPARLMAEGSPEFRQAYGVEVRTTSILIHENGSRFEPIIGKPGDGSSPSMAIVDEYHEHAESTLYDTMQTGMGSRQQPLMMVITTAGTDIGGPCYNLREQVTKMLDGVQPNERLFGVIYTIDEDDDWTSEAALRKANPNFGVSVSAEFLRAEQKTALENSRAQSVFKTKHLNVWVTARDAWMNMEWWHRQADPSLSPEQFNGEPCYAAIDLSNRIDLTAAARIFVRHLDGVPHYYAFGRYYCPTATVEDPKNRHYQGWVHDKFLTATEGDAIDYNMVRDDLFADARAHGLEEVGFDKWNAGKIEQDCQAEGLVVVEIPQNVQHYSPAMKEMEALVKSGQFHHDGNPLLAWAVSNVTVREDPNENIFPRKERRENKIDPATAVIMAFGRALVAQPQGEMVVDFV